MDQGILSSFKQHLNVLRKIFPSQHVYIAGGALRDLDNDKPIKDIDVFIHADDALAHQCKLSKVERSRPFTFVGAIERLYRAKANNLMKNYGSNWPSGLRLITVEELDTKPFKLQCILYQHGGHKGPKALLNYFDINLCKISFDGERVYRSDEYKEDVANKTISLDPLFRNNERTDRRLKYLAKKYSDFAVRRPAEPEPLTVRPVDMATISWEQLRNLTSTTWTTSTIR